MSVNSPEDIVEEFKRRGTSFNKSIAKDYEMFLKIKGIDNEMALVRARRIIEKIVVRLHNDHLSLSGKRNLHELIENLRKGNIISAIVYAQLLLVKEMGNYGAHSSEALFDDEQQISDAEMSLCDQAVYLITKFYVDNWPPSKSEIEENCLTTFLGSEIPRDRLHEIAYIDTLVYEKGVAVPFEKFGEWYDKNPDIFLCVEETSLKRIIGYICIIPLEESEFRKTLAGGFNEQDISGNFIFTYDVPDFYKAYLCSVAVEPSYQNITLVYKKLVDAYIEFLLKLAQSDVFIYEISAMAVSQEGERICRSLNMKRTGNVIHNSAIYHAFLLPPTFRVAYKDSMKLYRIYKKRYEEYKDIFEILAR